MVSGLRRAVIPALAQLLCACATPREAEPGVQTLAEIRFEGNQAIDAATLRGKILSTETASRPLGITISRMPFGAVRPFDPDTFKMDLQRIERLYRARGYLAARVVDSRVEETESGAAILTIQIEEGTQAKVVAIEKPGMSGVDPGVASRVLAELPLAEGGPFTEADYDRLKTILQERLREHGYAEATVGGKAIADPEKSEARILLEVEPGLRYRIGRLVVSGATAISKKRITDIAGLKEGDWYSTSKLNDAQQRVFDMGVFGGVRVSRGAVMRDRGVVPVLITVRESAFQTVKVGGGLGLERASRQEARARFEYTHRNLGGGQRRLSTEARLGYAVLQSVFDPQRHGPVGLLAVEFTQPNVALAGIDIVVRAEGERSLDLAFEDNALRGRVALAKYIGGRQLVLTPSANAEIHKIDGEVRAKDVRAGALAADCPFDPCVLSYLELRATADFRNNPLDPVRGTFWDLSLQRGLESVGSFGYWRGLVEGRIYRRVPFGIVLAARARLGGLFPSSEASPVVQRFFGGGGSDMRGFGTRRLAPLQPDPELTDASLLDKDTCKLGEKDCRPVLLPVGGLGLMEASFESRFRLTGSFGLTLFADAGEVVQQFSDLGFGKIEYAAGAGLRFKTFVGAIRADVAWRLNPQRLPALGPAVDGKVYRELDDRLQVHVSIGEAF